MEIELEPEQLEALRRASANGDYQLLLGAGASRDSKTRSGEFLPDSAKLTANLSAYFGVAVEDGDQLWRVYDRAVEAAGASTVYEWFRQGFWDVEAPYWMDYYARTPWATVWTLNVDNTFESAYRRIETSATRKLSVLNWDADYRQGRDLNIVHLHGVVDREDPRSLIFSLTEYASSARSGAAWPLNFRDSYGTAPFVILGARLRDEPDIEAVISRRHPSHAAPTFYVSRTISEATAGDMRRWNIVPIQMSGEDFALEWAKLTGLELDNSPTQEVELGLRLGRQLVELKAKAHSAVSDDHDFLGGDEPIWEDAVGGLIADTDWIRSAIADVNQVGTKIPRSSMIAFLGRRLTGRSAGLLELGKVLVAKSWRTFLFAADGRPDVDAIRKFAAGGKPVAILFDGFSEIADDLELLLAESRAAGLSVLCVGVDDIDREANILDRIGKSYLAFGRVSTINPRLSRTDANHIVDKLDQVGRLGFLESETSDRKRLAHFINSGIFPSMAQLENAPGFGRRVGELVKGLQNNDRVQLVFLAALASRAGHSLLCVDAARMTGVESEEIVRLIERDEQVRDLLSTDGKRVRTRHRWIALEHCVNRLGQEPALSFLGQALTRAAPRLSRESQRERNPTSVLVGSFMSQKFLREVFPDASLEPWYASLHSVFGAWSGRYWEQRAIVARRLGETQPVALSRAESFAIRASELVPDAYSFTTLGTVLLAKAAHAPLVDVAAYYERAFDTFERAGSSEKSNMVGWLAFLRYALPVLRRAISLELSTVSQISDGDDVDAQGTTLSQKVSDDWTTIYRQVAAIFGSSESTGSILTRLLREFEEVTPRH